MLETISESRQDDDCPDSSATPECHTPTVSSLHFGVPIKRYKGPTANPTSSSQTCSNTPPLDKESVYDLRNTDSSTNPRFKSSHSNPPITPKRLFSRASVPWRRRKNQEWSVCAVIVRRTWGTFLKSNWFYYMILFTSCAVLFTPLVFHSQKHSVPHLRAVPNTQTSLQRRTKTSSHRKEKSHSILLRHDLFSPSTSKKTSNSSHPRALIMAQDDYSELLIVERINLYKVNVEEKFVPIDLVDDNYDFLHHFIINDETTNRTMSRRSIVYRESDEDVLTQGTNLNSNEEEDACKPLRPWQETSFPTCNMIHEISLLSATHSDNRLLNRDREWLDSIDDSELPYPFQLVNHGYKRDVWSISTIVNTGAFRNTHLQDTNEKAATAHSNIQMLALKTLRYHNDIDDSDTRRGQWFDAVVSERLTSSKHIVNIYGYCGFSALFDYTSEGDLTKYIWDMTEEEKLKVAVDISSAIADLHNIDVEGQATVVHADINSDQFIKIGDSFVLNDFNTASPLYYTSTTNQQCPYNILYANDPNRAPEEFMYPNHGNLVNEKIDIYSLGNIFYIMVAGERRFEWLELEDARELILNGTMPDPIYARKNRLKKREDSSSTKALEEVEVSKIDEILIHAMKMCIVLDPDERSTARQVSTYLEGARRDYMTGRLASS